MPFSGDGKLMAALYIFSLCCASPPECNNTECKGRAISEVKSFSAPDTAKGGGIDNGIPLIVN